MWIRSSRAIPYRLPLKNAWHSAAGHFSLRSGWLLRLETDQGLLGWGDCAPLPGAAGGLEKRCHELSGLDEAEAHDWLKQAGLPAAAACAVDTALADLAAQACDIPLWKMLNPDAKPVVKCNAALGMLDKEAAQRADAAISDGFEVLKFKVGLTEANRELGLLRQLAQHIPRGVMLRLDANRAWNDKDAAYFLDELVGLPIDMLEEPLLQPDPAKLMHLQARVPFPLALDESLISLGLEKILATTPVQRLVLKPMLLGGLHAGFEIATRARAAGIMCVVTTTVDSAVGTLASLHLAAALSNGLHHGLATASWLERDIGRAPLPERGMLNVRSSPGLGFVPHSDLLA